MTPAEVWDRIREAADVMRRLPASIGPEGFKSTWPDVVKEGWLAAYDWVEGKYRDTQVRSAPPQGAEIDRADEVMQWLSCLARRDQKILWARANGAQWWQISRRLQVSDRTAYRWHCAALAIIVAHIAVNGDRNKTS